MAVATTLRTDSSGPVINVGGPVNGAAALATGSSSLVTKDTMHQVIPRKPNSCVIGWTKKAILFSLATILRSKTLLIYQSLNINRHYHIQTEWPKFKQEKTKKQEELQGKFQAFPGWDMNLWLLRKPKPKKRIYRHKYQKELKQYKKFKVLIIARENNESG